MRDLEDTQQQLLLCEKMASLGDLVAGVTHELNTPIGAAKSAVDVAERCVQRVGATLAQATDPLDEESRSGVEVSLGILKDNLANSQVAMDRITSIVDSLQNFARLDEAEYQRADLHEGIDSTLTLMHAELLAHVTLELRYGDIPEIHCNPGQPNQVFRILLKNAAAAIEGEGTITITTERRDDRVHIRVADSGCGIPADRLRRLFDFGFTKGESRVRLSSGLPTAYNIMQRHPGDIRLQSTVGEGTTVHLELPVT